MKEELIDLERLMKLHSDWQNELPEGKIQSLIKAKVGNFNFTGYNIDNLNMSGAKFKRSVFKGNAIFGNISEGEYLYTTFEDCIISPETATNGKFKNVIFNFCDIDTSLFMNISFLGCVFNDCLIHDVTFNNCAFKYCSFIDCNLDDADFKKCGFEHCDLGKISAIRDSIFDSSIFIESNLAGMDCNKCRFTYNRFDECLLDDMNISRFERNVINQSSYDSIVLMNNNVDDNVFR